MYTSNRLSEVLDSVNYYQIRPCLPFLNINEVTLRGVQPNECIDSLDGNKKLYYFNDNAEDMVGYIVVEKVEIGGEDNVFILCHNFMFEEFNAVKLVELGLVMEH